MGATYSTKLVLAHHGGNHCAFPGCPRDLTVDSPSGGEPVSTGEAAHIRGEKPGSARYDPTMTPEERDSYHNLIYLCADHATQIDRQERDFSVQHLLAMKADHEAKVRQAMLAAFADVAFPELLRATAWVRNAAASAFPRDFRIVTPDEKIRRNDLDAARLTITMGLGIAPVVHQFIENEAMLAPDYPDRLKSGFLSEYYRLRSEGLRGEALFADMCAFAERGLREQRDRSAAIAVLVYLFERCEVFEK